LKISRTILSLQKETTIYILIKYIINLTMSSNEGGLTLQAIMAKLKSKRFSNILVEELFETMSVVRVS
jgi:hypothetical protein